MNFSTGQTYTLTHEPHWSTGDKKGKQVMVIDMGDYLAFKIEGLDVTWPVNEYEIS